MSVRPNIVLICVDQWRGDCLSIDEHPVVHTPFLDRLAASGMRFTRTYSATPTCIPARAALLTGLSQRSHRRVGYQDGNPWDYPVTIASEFTRNGYQTQAVGKMHVFPERSQMGFQNVVLHDGFLHFTRRRECGDIQMVDDYVPWLREKTGRPEADYTDHGIDCNSNVARPWDKDEYLHPTNWVTHQSIEFLRRRDTRKPFFLFMSFHRPHPPYDPPSWAFDMYKDAPMPEPPAGDWIDLYANCGDARMPDTFYGDIDPRLLQRARAGYYGHMTHIDHQIERFLDSLREHGVGENTWICFVSDHGEMIGDHHLFRKGFPYEGSARVPLILKGPANADLKRNTTCDVVVELRDVMPTLLDCAGLTVPEEVEGRSLLRFARGVSPIWRNYLHGEHTMFGQSLHWITSDREKYVWLSGSGQEQMFDLANDPQELHDLSKTKEAYQRIARLRQLLVHELTGREEGFTDGTQLIAGRPVRNVLSL